MKIFFLFALAFFIAGEIANTAEVVPAIPDLRVTVDASHFWNDVKIPASGARHESYWSYSHAVEFTVPKEYEPGMKFLFFSVIEQGEQLRSTEFSMIDADGKEIAHGIKKGMPFTYTATSSTCTFTDAPASLSSRQFRRYGASGEVGGGQSISTAIRVFSKSAIRCQNHGGVCEHERQSDQRR